MTMGGFDLPYSNLIKGKELLYSIFKDDERFINNEHLNNQVIKDVNKYNELKELLKTLPREEIDENIYLRLANDLMKRSKKDCLKMLNQLLIGLCNNDVDKYNVESILPEKTNKIIESASVELCDYCCDHGINDKIKYKSGEEVEYILRNIYRLRLNKIISKYKLDFSCYAVNAYQEDKLIISSFVKENDKNKTDVKKLKKVNK